MISSSKMQKSHQHFSFSVQIHANSHQNSNLFSRNRSRGSLPTDQEMADFKADEGVEIRKVLDSSAWPPGEIKPVTDLIKQYHADGIKLAVATSGHKQHVMDLLRDLGIFDLFDTMVFTHEVQPRGKPHPDIYFKAAERLGVSPKKCRV